MASTGTAASTLPIDFYRDGGKPNAVMTGGGLVTYDSAFNLSWSQRFIMLGGGASTDGGVYSTQGHYNIDMPPIGTVIPALGIGTPKTVTAAGILMNQWGSLYYKLTGIHQGSNPANFIFVGYGAGNYTVTNDMVLVATVNDDPSRYIRLGTGDFLLPNTIASTFEPRMGGTAQPAQLVAGVIPRGYNSYFDADANWTATVTLPTGSNQIGDLFTFNHTATMNTTIAVANTSMTAPLLVTAAMKGATWSWTGTRWDLLTNLPSNENIPAQTGLGLVLSAIPAPTASQSPWGTNMLGETLHYMPGIGWKIVADHFKIDTTYPNPPLPNSTFTPLFSYTVPRAGRILATATLDATNDTYPSKIRLLMRKNTGAYTVNTGTSGSPADGVGTEVTDQYDVVVGDVIMAFALPGAGAVVYTAYNVTSSFTYLI